MSIFKKLCLHINCNSKTVRIGTIRVAVETTCKRCGSIAVDYVKPTILYTDLVMNHKELLDRIKEDENA